MQNKLIYIYSIALFINVVCANTQLILDEIYLKLNINRNKIHAEGYCGILDTIIHEQNDLIPIGNNILGKEIFLSKKCAYSWENMKKDALKDSIHISVLSGFRYYNKQYMIIKNKLDRGLTFETILQENKLPGLSHHHSGNAIDITSNSYKLSLEFEKSLAYLWLIKNAHKYGFYLQYPKNNKSGIMFEPWHWYFKE